MDISVIIPTYNCAEYLNGCLNYLRLNTYNNFEVVVVDDASTDNTSEIVKKWSGLLNIKYLCMNINTRGSWALNMGVLEASNDVVILLNDDMIAPPQWDKRMIEAMDHKCDVICAQLIEPGIVPVHKDLIKYDCGMTINEFDYQKFVDYELRNRKDKLVDQKVHPIMIRRDLYLVMGGHDPTMSHADTDFYIRLSLLGVNIKKTLNVMFYHFSGKSFRSNPDKSLGSRNDEILIKKWRNYAL